MARRTKGDKFADDYVDDVEGSSCAHADRDTVQPLTTKAGGRLWSITFAAHDTSGSGKDTCTGLRAAYPLQLLVRFDVGRQALVYDAFEFKPQCGSDVPPLSDAQVRASCVVLLALVVACIQAHTMYCDALAPCTSCTVLIGCVCVLVACYLSKRLPKPERTCPEKWTRRYALLSHLLSLSLSAVRCMCCCYDCAARTAFH